MSTSVETNCNSDDSSINLSTSILESKCDIPMKLDIFPVCGINFSHDIGRIFPDKAIMTIIRDHLIVPPRNCIGALCLSFEVGVKIVCEKMRIFRNIIFKNSEIRKVGCPEIDSFINHKSFFSNI